MADNDLLAEFDLLPSQPGQGGRQGAAQDARPENHLTALTDAWRTEVHAPELLPYKTDLVEQIKEILQAQTVSGRDRGLYSFFHSLFLLYPL